MPNTLTPAIPDPESPATPASKTFDIDSTLVYQVDGPSDFIFQIHALDGMDQELLDESVSITPELPWRVHADPTLHHRYMRLHADAGTFELRYRARVRRLQRPVDLNARELPIAELPDAALPEILPSRYCESDHLSRAAQSLFGAVPQGYGRVQAIMDWIYDNIQYQIGTSVATTTARDVFVQRVGVCRDFAHLAIAFCRALNIPARLVVGYTRFDDPPPDFHAVVEVYLGDGWVTFDATRMSPVEDLIRISTGRDAKDVAFATIFGPTRMLSMAPNVEPVR